LNTKQPIQKPQEDSSHGAHQKRSSNQWHVGTTQLVTELKNQVKHNEARVKPIAQAKSFGLASFFQ
jgi:hypothetical protein